jgi:hypothetical protein
MATEPVTADPESEPLEPGRLDNILNDLRAHWTAASGPVYLFRYDGQWVATYVGTGQELTAASAEELRRSLACPLRVVARHSDA